MKTIALNHGQVALVDDEDFERLNQFRWYAEFHHGKWRACRKPSTGLIFMHRAILGVDKGVLVDHKDGDSLNNRRSNLRPATNAQNLANSKSRNGTSKYKGVCKGSGGKPWRANIVVNGKQVYLGTFKNETEAATAYDLAAHRYYGDFARYNFVQEAR